MYLEYPNFCVFHGLGSIHVKASRFLSFAVWYNHISRPSLTQLLLLLLFFFFLQTASVQKPELGET